MSEKEKERAIEHSPPPALLTIHIHTRYTLRFSCQLVDVVFVLFFLNSKTSFVSAFDTMNLVDRIGVLFAFLPLLAPFYHRYYILSC